jgi:uncharacterized membrane protein YdjX (TVP38/TMEM64 family)
MGLTHYLSLEELNKHQAFLKSYIASHKILAPFLFIVFYIVLTMLALPFDTFLTLLGGFLFPEPYSLIYVTIGASTGATLLFLAAKTAFGDFFFKWAGPFLKKMEEGFRENAGSYILFLRLIPIFPFWLTNLSPAFFGVPLFTYYWATLIGVVPFAFVVTYAGAGISAIVDAHQAMTFDKIFNANVKIALFGLAFLSLIPIVFKRWWKVPN